MSLLCRRVCRVCRACSRFSCSTAGTGNSAGCLAACNLGGRHSRLNILPAMKGSFSSSRDKQSQRSDRSPKSAGCNLELLQLERSFGFV